jgi:hypothetical protein
VILPLPAFIGESDCEAIGDGLLRQPANAISSLAYVTFGSIIIGWALRADGDERIHRAVFGALMILTGAGSVLYHGPQGQFAHSLHDLSFAAALCYLSAANTTAAASMRLRTTFIVAGSAIVVVAMVRAAAPSSINVITAVLIAAVITSDVFVHRRRGVAGSWYAAALILAAMGVVSLLLGRSGALLCDPDSIAQGHAAWHVLSAAALSAYFVATAPARTPRTVAA